MDSGPWGLRSALTTSCKSLVYLSIDLSINMLDFFKICSNLWISHYWGKQSIAENLFLLCFINVSQRRADRQAGRQASAGPWFGGRWSSAPPHDLPFPRSHNPSRPCWWWGTDPGHAGHSDEPPPLPGLCSYLDTETVTLGQARYFEDATRQFPFIKSENEEQQKA